MQWCAVGFTIYLALILIPLAALGVSVVLDRRATRRELERSHPLMQEYVSTALTLADEHRRRTGHSFGNGTGQPDTCDVCRVIAGG